MNRFVLNSTFSLIETSLELIMAFKKVKWHLKLNADVISDKIPGFRYEPLFYKWQKPTFVSV